MRDYLVDCYAQYRYLGTLTIADDILSPMQFKRALDKYLVWMVRAMRRFSANPATASVLWFLEFQKRGAPHAHILYTDFLNWEACATGWALYIDQPWAFQTCTKFERLRAGRGGSVAYAMKYASKMDQKELPEGLMGYGRWWGVRGYRDTMAAAMVLDINPGNVDDANFYLERAWEAVKDGRTKGEVKVVQWEFGDGLVAWRCGGHWDAYLSDSRWREAAELSFTKLVLLGAELTHPNDLAMKEVEDAGFAAEEA